MADGDFGGYGGGGAWGPGVIKSPAHYRLTFAGQFGDVGAAIEKWSFSVALPDNADAANVVGDLTASGGLFGDYLKQHINIATRLTSVNLSAIAEGGKYARAANGTYLRNTTQAVDVVGTGTGPMFPPQVALAVTLETGVPGRSGLGRFFLPGVSKTLTGFRMTTADADAIASSCKSFLAGLNTVWAAPVSVASSTGPVRPVTALRVGRALDTIRSRREDVLEDYRRLPL